MLTIPLIVVSADVSFSKLKLIKTYLWSMMAHEKLNALDNLPIENELRKLNFKDI